MTYVQYRDESFWMATCTVWKFWFWREWYPSFISVLKSLQQHIHVNVRCSLEIHSHDWIKSILLITHCLSHYSVCLYHRDNHSHSGHPLQCTWNSDQGAQDLPHRRGLLHRHASDVFHHQQRSPREELVDLWFNRWPSFGPSCYIPTEQWSLRWEHSNSPCSPLHVM